MAIRPKRPTRVKRKMLPDTDDFVRVSRATVGLAQQFIVKVGTAILGGDLTGNARGQNSIDIATDRTGGASGVTEVASGDNSVAIGMLNTVSGDFAVRIGYAGLVSGENGVGIGNNASVSGESGVAVGLNSNAEGEFSVAVGGADIRTESGVGLGSTARLLNATYAFNTGVAPVIKRGAGLIAEANWPRHLGGCMAVYMSGAIDLKSTGLKTLALPDGVRMLIFGCGIECESVSGLTVQPTIRFGATFSDQKYVADRQTTQLTAAAKREYYLPETLSDFETDPNFTVVTGSTATTHTARLYWVGLLLEDE